MTSHFCWSAILNHMYIYMYKHIAYHFLVMIGTVSTVNDISGVSRILLLHQQMLLLSTVVIRKNDCYMHYVYMYMCSIK